ncbi:hypothetical protein J2S09_003524 [Bacillus fengqiuensis]|nr:hypothetical protein [Bacillus fengqiuensis]
MIPYISKTELLSLPRNLIALFGRELPVQVSSMLNKRHHYYFPITYLYEQLNHGQVVRLIEQQSS